MKILILVILLMHYGKTTGFAEAYKGPEAPSDNKVFIITLDGFRWQELFGGADPELIRAAGASKQGILKNFNHPNAAVRRRQLLPFLWSKVAAEGQLIGNRALGSKVNITNPYALSYAGYNELFTGSPDHFIWNNGKKANGNRTVLAHLAAQPQLAGKVASVASWDAFEFILNKQHSGVHINSGPQKGKAAVRSDEETFAAASSYILKNRPRVLHLGFSGTDEAGHEGNYSAYLQQAHRADRHIEKLWSLVQALPFYSGKTTFVITTDHGRGSGRSNWHRHGVFIPGASQTWLALMGKGIQPLGESRQAEQLYGTQVAGTIALLMQVSGFKPYTLPGTKFTQTSGF